MAKLESLQNLNRRKKNLSAIERKANKKVADINARAKRPSYVYADMKDGYDKVRIVVYNGNRYVMKPNGFVWDYSCDRWVPFYKLLLGM